MAERAVLLASGGLDSTTLAYQLSAEEISITPLFVDYGQHCSATEFTTLQNVLPPPLRRGIVRIDISDVYQGTSSRLIAPADLWQESISHDDLYLPYRNLLLS